MREFPLGPGRVRLSVRGVIDLRFRDELRNRLIAMIAIDRVEDLVVDLNQVEFLDCSGIGALVDGSNADAADAASTCKTRAIWWGANCSSLEPSRQWMWLTPNPTRGSSGLPSYAFL